MPRVLVLWLPRRLSNSIEPEGAEPFAGTAQAGSLVKAVDADPKRLSLSLIGPKSLIDIGLVKTERGVADPATLDLRFAQLSWEEQAQR